MTRSNIKTSKGITRATSETVADISREYGIKFDINSSTSLITYLKSKGVPSLGDSLTVINKRLKNS